MRPPIPHYAKGDLTAARSRLAELAKREGKRLGRPPVPPYLRKSVWSSICLTEAAYGALKARAEYEGRPMAAIVRASISQYLRIHKDHLDEDSRDS